MARAVSGRYLNDRALLSDVELGAAHEFIDIVRAELPARLVQASLFGSAARGQAGEDSDVDILLVFERLTSDREPFATHAEAIAERVARRTWVPISTWVVSLVDLERGNRTPMLVDALDDSIPLWCRRAPLSAVPFAPEDASCCIDALLQHVAEGANEVDGCMALGDEYAAARRARDDLVRLCTAALLLHGVTRPRRGEAVRRFVSDELGAAPHRVLRVFEWAAISYGPSEKDDHAPIFLPPDGMGVVREVIEGLRRGVIRGMGRLTARVKESIEAEYSDSGATPRVRSL